MAVYTARQEQILEKLGKDMGFSLSEITNVSFNSNIPVSVTYKNQRGEFTRQTYNSLGSILNNSEMALLKSSNSDRQQSVSNAFLSAQSLLGARKNAKVKDFATSSGKESNITYNLTSNFDPRTTRLAVSGLTKSVSNKLTSTNTSNSTNSKPKVQFANDSSEDRVRISDPTGIFIGSSSGPLGPLAKVGFVLFPYTPTISINHTANYDQTNLTHSNYSYPFYQNSPTASISITGVFTAKDADSAAYVIAVQHFFRSVTKMFYGKDAEAGTPPPVLRLDGHGEYQFSSIPIVITDFSESLPNEVDYITTGSTRVPTMQEISISCMPLYSRKSISQEFGLRDFAAGKLLGKAGGRGGFI